MYIYIHIYKYNIYIYVLSFSWLGDDQRGHMIHNHFHGDRPFSSGVWHWARAFEAMDLSW
jgi:hypothetical protein